MEITINIVHAPNKNACEMQVIDRVRLDCLIIYSQSQKSYKTPDSYLVIIFLYMHYEQ